MTRQSRYLAFLVRFQRGEGERHWRASLQDVRTQTTMQFATEIELIRHMLTTMADAAAQETEEADRSDPEVP